jgi:hypothetical protein
VAQHAPGGPPRFHDPGSYCWIEAHIVSVANVLLVPLGLWSGIAGKTSTPPPTGSFSPIDPRLSPQRPGVSPAYPAIEPGPGGQSIVRTAF